ncbi:hypothetical protein [Gynuella sunshinyii]|uniref:hypothetical protein n=1 Tax=Gynuella sunshinyii TaxID=1445505 RepID=UPI0005CC0D1D|nr:hypothetical protein [Gynuella sunshinyii]
MIKLTGRDVAILTPTIAEISSFIRRTCCFALCCVVGHRYQNYFYSSYRLERCRCCGRDIIGRKAIDLKFRHFFKHRVYQTKYSTWCYEIYYGKKLFRHETGFRNQHDAVLFLDVELSKLLGS